MTTNPIEASQQSASTPTDAVIYLARTRRRTMRRKRVRVIILAIAMVLTPLLTVTIGPAAVPVCDVIGVIMSHIPGLDVNITWSRAVDAIVWQTRLPRIITGLAVGAILGVAGVVLQALVRNPLAEPYVLGVSSGASTGAATAIILVGAASSATTGAFAFVGALVATSAVMAIAGRGNSPLHLILAGLAVGFGFQALTNLLIFSSGSPETSQSVMFWMLGSLGRALWAQVPLVTVVAVLLTIAMAICGPILDALASGDRTAQSVGLNPAKARIIFLVPVSAAIALAVAAAGGIGFVGLIIPHIIRNLVGHSHRYLVIGSALASALFLVWTDAVARIIFAPAELPIGVMTGLIGAPFLTFMVARRHQIG